MTDFEEIWRFLVAESASSDVADRVVRSLHSKCEAYAVHPLLGELRPDLMPELRCFSVANFAVLDLPTEYGLVVLQVIHGAQDIPARFRQ